MGCGRGEVMERLAAAGYEAYGCDSDPWCVQSSGRYGDTVRLAVEEVAPEVVGKFDCVILSHVLEHVEEPRQAILAVPPSPRSSLSPSRTPTTRPSSCAPLYGAP